MYDGWDEERTGGAVIAGTDSANRPELTMLASMARSLDSINKTLYQLAGILLAERKLRADEAGVRVTYPMPPSISPADLNAGKQIIEPPGSGLLSAMDKMLPKLPGNSSDYIKIYTQLADTLIDEAVEALPPESKPEPKPEPKPPLPEKLTMRRPRISTE